MTARWYVGKCRSNGKWVAFLTTLAATEENYGSTFAVLVGPFRTRRGAEFMARYGSSNPHCQNVEEAEKLARLEHIRTV